jgi:HPt (histidine-containing phosphotransfer) domain-containing protein
MIENNKQQTAVDWYDNQLRKVFSNKTEASNFSHEELLQQAKEIENQQSQLYATFCLRCANENLPIIRFKDWINLEGGEQ